MSEPSWDQDAMDAGLDLIGRTGAMKTEVGYRDEDAERSEDADWYASAQYYGARVISEHHIGPVEAVEGLARRLLADGKCAFCGQEISLGDFPGKRCRWTRNGAQWVRGCEATHSERDPKIVAAGRLQARGPQRGHHA